MTGTGRAERYREERRGDKKPDTVTFSGRKLKILYLRIMRKSPEVFGALRKIAPKSKSPREI